MDKEQWAAFALVVVLLLVVLVFQFWVLAEVHATKRATESAVAEMGKLKAAASAAANFARFAESTCSQTQFSCSSAQRECSSAQRDAARAASSCGLAAYR